MLKNRKRRVNKYANNINETKGIFFAFFCFLLFLPAYGGDANETKPKKLEEFKNIIFQISSNKIKYKVTDDIILTCSIINNNQKAIKCSYLFQCCRIGIVRPVNTYIEDVPGSSISIFIDAPPGTKRKIHILKAKDVLKTTFTTKPSSGPIGVYEISLSITLTIIVDGIKHSKILESNKITIVQQDTAPQ